MRWDTHTLTGPSGLLLSEGKRDEVEDAFAREIETHGFPSAGSYIMRCHWVADSRSGIEGTEMASLYLGCGPDGWFRLDTSRVPEAAAPARRLEEITT